MAFIIKLNCRTNTEDAHKFTRAQGRQAQKWELVCVVKVIFVRMQMAKQARTYKLENYYTIKKK